MAGTALSAACVDAHRSMGYVHKLRLERQELDSLEKAELPEHDTRSWVSLAATLAAGVLFALIVLSSVLMLQ